MRSHKEAAFSLFVCLLVFAASYLACSIGAAAVAPAAAAAAAAAAAVAAAAAAAAHDLLLVLICAQLKLLI